MHQITLPVSVHWLRIFLPIAVIFPSLLLLPHAADQCSSVGCALECYGAVSRLSSSLSTNLSRSVEHGCIVFCFWACLRWLQEEKENGLCERSLTLVKVDALVRTTLGSVQLRSRSRHSELNCCLTKGVLKRPGSSIYNLKWHKHTVELRCTIFLRNKLAPFSDLLMRALPVRICIHAILFFFFTAYCRCSLDTVDFRSTQKIALRCYLLEDVCSKIVHLIPLITAAIIHAARHMQAFEAVCIFVMWFVTSNIALKHGRHIRLPYQTIVSCRVRQWRTAQVILRVLTG